MISPKMSFLSATKGIPVYDWNDPWVRTELAGRARLPDDFDLKYDQVYIAETVLAILVGELAHFQWRMQQIEANEQCRAQAAAHIESQARRILGEPWELSSP